MLSATRLVRTLHQRRDPFTRLYRSFHSHTDPRVEKAVYVTNERGSNVIHDPLLSKGTAFTIDERERLAIRGLLPSRHQEMGKQLLRVKRNLDACPTPLSKYIYLAALHDRNETLYYKLLMKHMNELASIVYTPTVGEASQISHAIYRRPRGMYFSTQDKGQMSAMVYNWPQDEVDVIVVTDGSRILGLGDLGANGMQIPIGKLSLYVAAGGIRPRAVLPVVLDVGTNNKELLNDPLYLGMPHPRLTENEYYEFVDEWVTAVKSRWPDVLIQFEDFQNPHAYNLLNRYRDSITCTNDDIQSTSAVTLAGILASLKARGKAPDSLSDERIVCVGAGTSGVGVCEGIVDCMVDQGRVKSREEAYSKIYMLDSSGLLGNPSISSDSRTARKRDQSVSEQQRPYVKRNLPDQLSLEEIVRQVKPTVLLGFTGTRGVFTEKVIREMANHYEKPVIFPLSNPDSHSECTAEEAFKWTDGRAIFASGTQFDEVRLPNGKVGKTNQCNNSYTFPGVGLGVVVSKATKVTDRMFLEAGRTLAEMASESQLKQGQLFPHVDHLREVSFKIGTRVCEVAFEDGVANATLKEGELLSELIKNTAYEPQYVPLVYHPKL